LSPQMTVVSTSAVEMAEAAIGILLDEIARKRHPTGTRIECVPRLVIRDSTAAPLLPLPA